MSIRPMENAEIVKALRQAARVCLEKDRRDWYGLDVCIADATYHAASAMLVRDDGYERNPEHAATFLLLCAEAT